MRTIFLIIFPILFLQCSKPISDIERIKENYRDMLLNRNENDEKLIEILQGYTAELEVSDQVVVDVQQRYPITKPQIDSLINLQLPDGSWSDINYSDTKSSGWDPKRHAERLLIMSKAFVDSNHPYYEDAEVQQCIKRAIVFWDNFVPVTVQWWYREIGVPKTIGEAFILYEPYMTELEMDCAIKEMSKSSIRGTGQNLVWQTGNVLIKGLLQNDTALVRECRDVIMGEAINERREGIKPDWSFHQHGPLQQFGNYGMSFTMSMGLYVTLFNNTGFAFTDDKIDILTQFIKNGYRWTLWNGMLDVNTLTRQFYHNAPQDKGIGLGFATSQLYTASGDEELKNILKENFSATNSTQFTGNNYFWCSDYGVHRTSKWMASVRCSSSRIIGTEEVNHDNMIGSYVGDGVTLVYQRGDEYQNVMAVWDWNKLPGVTAWTGDFKDLHPNKKENNKASFVGGVSNRESGLWTMDVDRGDGLTAQKSWITTPDFILCLGSGISTPHHGALTTIDQRFKRNDLKHFENGLWKSVDGVETIIGDARFYHDNMGYITLGDEASTTYGCTSQQGEWKKVMGFYKPKTETADVVTLQINHGEMPKNKSYSYLLLPGMTERQVADFDISSINILKCDNEGKAVITPSGELFVEAKTPFKLQLPSSEYFEAITPALYILGADKTSVVVSEPTQTLTHVEGIYADKKFAVDFDSNQLGQSLALSLNN